MIRNVRSRLLAAGALLTMLAVAGCSTRTPRVVETNAIVARPSAAQQNAAPIADVSPEPRFRPPAVPLVTSDPYLSIWSESDTLNDSTTVHWTGSPNPLVCLIRIDGQAYRLMGNDPASVHALPQISMQVTPTRSIYTFANQSVEVALTFMTAALPNDLNVLTRPLSYLSWKVMSLDGKQHAVSLYASASSLLAVNTPDQPVEWNRESMGPLTALRVGTTSQTYFIPQGDPVRIDWGYAYAAAPTADSSSSIGSDAQLLSDFVSSGTIPAALDTQMPRAPLKNEPVLAFVFPLGNVGASPVSRHMMIAYDEIYNIEWFGEKLRPYWRRNGTTPAQMLEASEKDYPSLVNRCANFDQELQNDADSLGGKRYAQVCALAYRQALAATGISVDSNGKPLLFTKENTSNGDIATVDVLFPTDPMFLLLNPNLAEASAVPILAYAASPHWKFPNAPHDLGTYPIALGRDDGGEAMPVEESGNMLLLCDAICKANGNANFVKPWWPQLTQWAKYLKQYGLDPGNQLSTDDFMGPLAHNANLSVKAILGLAAYGDLCRRRGETAQADAYRALAITDATHWVQVADKGQASLLAFGMPNTWIQKYNMIWDRVLGLNIFSAAVQQKEIDWYISKLQTYGVPLDSRTLLGDTDHSFFSASMADNESQFKQVIDPIYAYLNATPVRLPLCDTYQTNNLNSGGMHARSVVGGVFIRFLTDQTLWSKWADQTKSSLSGWAPLPPAPRLTTVIPTSAVVGQTWRYTTTANPPPADWTATHFNDSSWKSGQGVFGTYAPTGATVRTKWTDTPGDIWLRRKVTLPLKTYPHLKFYVFHDEDVQIYVDGIMASQGQGFVGNYVLLDISPQALALLKPGATVEIAMHCHQTTGGQGVDAGLVDAELPASSSRG